MLKKRRNKLRTKLQILRLKQPLAHRKLAEVNQIIEQAKHLNAKIIEETDKLKQHEMENLKSKYDAVYHKFQKTNLDTNAAFPQFNVEVLRAKRQVFS